MYPSRTLGAGKDIAGARLPELWGAMHLRVHVAGLDPAFPAEPEPPLPSSGDDRRRQVQSGRTSPEASRGAVTLDGDGRRSYAVDAARLRSWGDGGGRCAEWA